MKCESLTGKHADFSHANLLAARWRHVSIAQIKFNEALHLDTLQRFPVAVEPLPRNGWRFLWGRHSGDINACSMSADGRRFITASNDRTARVWDEKGQCLLTLEGHEGYVRACSMSADGTRMITKESDGTARVWNEQGKYLPDLGDGASLGETGSMSADGRRKVEIFNGALRLSVLDDGVWKCTLELHPQTGTVIWLDKATRRLKIKGPDWPFWQLVPPNDEDRNMLGETIAAFGPMAHKDLANADEWDFLPRDDIQADGG
jgi:hypothetical protein